MPAMPHDDSVNKQSVLVALTLTRSTSEVSVIGGKAEAVGSLVRLT
jgi:hypothetical protein